MCTLIALIEPKNEDWPVIISSNRDEVPNRPTRMPDWLTPDVYAPADAVYGGTWIGLNRRGVLVALTNRPLPHGHRPGRRSRGLLVTDALKCGTAEAAIESVRSWPADAYNGFHLFATDGRSSGIVWSNGIFYRTERLEPGLYVVTGDGFGHEHSKRDWVVRRAVSRSRMRQRLAPYRTWPEDVLALHGKDYGFGDEDGTCVHGEESRKQTTFSMTFRLAAAGDRWVARWRDGRPCQRGPWNVETVMIER